MANRDLHFYHNCFTYNIAYTQHTTLMLMSDQKYIKSSKIRYCHRWNRKIKRLKCEKAPKDQGSDMRNIKNGLNSDFFINLVENLISSIIKYFSLKLIFKEIRGLRFLGGGDQ